MTRAGMDLQTRVYASAIIVLIVGLCSAVAIYLTAGDDSDAAQAYQFVVVDGKTYPIAPGQSRMYMREVQRFGGKAGVLFDELDRWFAGLWRGKSLALTVGWIAACLSAGLFLVGWIQPAGAERDDAGDRNG